jgi:flavin reductase (DIM6/NTAB) family NADH-FMN oxidoreductase RutF
MKRVRVSEALARKYPEWIVLVVTRRSDGLVDVMPAGWAMVTSGRPPMFAVSVGHGRYTHELVERGGEFVIAFPSPGMGPAIDYCGSHSGRDVDKIAQTSLEVLPAAEVAPPLIKGAIANLECRLAGSLSTGDHTIFAGEIVAAHIEEEVPARLVNFGAGRYAPARPE